MIHIIIDMKNSKALIDAIPEPKHVWWDIDRVVVSTGTDMPQPETP